VHHDLVLTKPAEPTSGLDAIRQDIDPRTVAGIAPRRSLSMLSNSIALIAGKLATMGLGFLSWLVAARLFDQREVGLSSGTVSAMMLCVQIALFGAGAAVITLYPRHQESPGGLLNTSFWMVGIAALLASTATLVLAATLLGELSIIAERPAYAVTFTVMTLAGALGVLFDQISTAIRRGDLALTRGIVNGAIILLLVAVMPRIFDASSALAILLAWTGGNLAMVSLGIWQLRRAVPGYRLQPRVDLHLAGTISRTGLPNWMLTLTERAPGTLLPVVATELLSAESNAAWYAAWMMAWVVYVVPIQVGLNLFAEASHAPERLIKAVRQGIMTSLAIGVTCAIGAAIIGPLMLQFLGSGYADEGTTPLRILLVAVVPFTFIQAYFAICRSTGLLGEAIATGLLAAASGILAAAIAGNDHGLKGMALAWLVTQSLAGIWAVWRLRRLILRGAALSS
jgi:O-antigen/teichoic acid export membrane protein